MFGRFFRKSVPLAGAPAVRRQKTYSAQSGYVYQYYYLGMRHYGRPGEEGVEYVFEVSADRKTSTPVSVLLSNDSVASWQERHGRELSAAERYAIAKMSLFQAFDERPNPAAMRQGIGVRAADVEAILENLSID